MPKRAPRVSRKVILDTVGECGGSQTAAAEKLGVSRAWVSYVVNHPPGTRQNRRPPKNPRPARANGPLRKDTTNLQVPGVYSLAQQKLAVALKDVNKSELASELGYKKPEPLYWLCDGSLPRPALWLAVVFEKRFGIPCVDWYEPPVKE